MNKTTKPRRFGLLDGILCVVAALAIGVASCYFLAADGSAVSAYTVAQSDNVMVSLTKAALTGIETEVSAPELNRLLQTKLSASPSGIQQILLKPSGTDNEIEFCITARAKGHSWVLSGKGTLLAKTEDNTVTAFVFAPEQLRLGKLPVSRNLFFSLLQPEQLPDGITVDDGKLSFSASLMPVSLSSFRVSDQAFVFRPKGPLDQLMDKIDDFAQKEPGKQSQTWQELQQQITEQTEQALAQGTDAMEQLRQKMKEQYPSLDIDRIFSGVESSLQNAASQIGQNSDKVASAVQNLLDALQSTSSQAE